MSGDLTILRELTEIAKTAGSMGGGKGRYSRTPDFSAPSHTSSRPKTDRGTTFHFSHKTISKKTDIADGRFSQTTSAAHQGYIERPSATEHMDADVKSGLFEDVDPSEQKVIQPSGFSYPSRTSDPRRISFGTLGITKADRKQFWDGVEASEQRNARVQSRIIAELPVELSALDRTMLARDFCQQSFEDRGLPYWATLHAPTKKNDPRNYHLHITYSDRPAGRAVDGQWDFQVTKKKTRANRSIVLRRPFKSPKHPDTRAIGWPKRLRRSFADTCNFYLAMSGISKRHDPRSYKDAGILKEPTEHLGNKCSAFESFGLDTEPGKRNARKEIRWRFAQAEAPWVERAFMLRDSTEMNHPSMSETKKQLFDIASEGISKARRSTSHLVTAELLSHRLNKRDEFLDTEVLRISKKDDVSSLSYDAQNRLALEAEAMLINDRKSRIQELVAKCKLNANKLDKTARKMKQEFDRLVNTSTAADLFIEDDSADFESIDELVQDDPHEQNTSNETDPFLDPKDETDIGAFLGDLDLEKPVNSASAVSKKLESQVSNQDVIVEEVDAVDDIPSHAIDKPIAKSSSRVKDPIEDIISKIAGLDSGADTTQNPAVQNIEDYPGTMPIAASNTAPDIKKLDQALRSIDNRQLRQTAIANRDATDICPPGLLQEQFNRGWVVLRFEAARRGLDLDTGIHDPSKATDAERATLHLDQEPCPIRVIRKDLARQRVRT